MHLLKVKCTLVNSNQSQMHDLQARTLLSRLLCGLCGESRRFEALLRRPAMLNLVNLHFQAGDKELGTLIHMIRELGF